MNNLRYLLMPMLFGVHITLFTLGGAYFWVSFALAVFLGTIVEELLKDDKKTSVISIRNTTLANNILYGFLPIIGVMACVFVYHTSNIPNFSLHIFGYDLGERRAVTQSNPIYILGALMAFGSLLSTGATNIAHELIHRRKSKASQLIARWLMAFSWDTTFTIEHLYGHHRYVATFIDANSSRRGENLYAFIPRSSYQAFTRAFKIEKERLQRKCKGAIHWQNKALRGQLMSLTVYTAAYLIGNLSGMIFLFCAALVAKFWLESVNYLQHHGLVRVPGKPIMPRHSWDSNRWISNTFLFNLSRHSQHHMKGSAPYWELQITQDSPKLPYGYLTSVLIAMVPPLWFKIINPELEKWDAEKASIEELKLLGKSIPSSKDAILIAA